ncbi:MAG: DinB family protein [Gemmatimonadales bacterium]
MTELARYRRLLEHDGWANFEALESLKNGPASEKARIWLAHIVGAERTWLARIRQEPPTMPVWPDLDLTTCETEVAALQAEWARCLQELDEEALEDGVAYRNSKGQFWTSSVEDILTHVVLHAAYHRGQIAAAVREAGGSPAYTDYIHAVRSGLVE